MRFTETFFSSGHWCDAYHVEYGEVNVVSCDRFDLAQKFVWALTGEDVKAQTTAIDYRPRSVLTVDSRCDVFNMYATNKGELEKFRANLAGLGVVLLSFPENWTPFDKTDELVGFVRDSTEVGIQTFVFKNFRPHRKTATSVYSFHWTSTNESRRDCNRRWRAR